MKSEYGYLNLSIKSNNTFRKHQEKSTKLKKVQKKLIWIKKQSAVF